MLCRRLLMATFQTDPRFVKGVELIGRAGVATFELRYSDPSEDGDKGPVVWMAIAEMRPRFHSTVGRYVVDASIDPLNAVMRLCERLIDGGECSRCHRPSAFDAGFESSFMDDKMCWVQWDPELEMFRPGCEGD